MRFQKTFLRRVIIPSMLFLAASTAFGQTFESLVYEALKAQRPDLQFRYDSTDNLIYAGKAALSLSNVKKEIAAKGLDGKNAVAFAVSSITPNLDLILGSKSDEKPWTEVKDRVFPAIAPLEYKNAALCNQLSQLVATCYVVDYPNGRRYITRAQLESWRISGDELALVAFDNLKKLADKNPIGVSAGSGQIEYIFSQTRDSYDAARLLLPQLQAMLMSTFKNGVFVAIPNRDFLIAWSSGRAQHEQIVHQIESDYRSNSYPLTHELFVIDDRGLRVATEAERRFGTIRAR